MKESFKLADLLSSQILVRNCPLDPVSCGSRVRLCLASHIEVFHKGQQEVTHS